MPITTPPSSNDALVELLQSIYALTPRVYVTRTIVVLNAIVFVLMVFSGVSLTQPTGADLVEWGANSGPLTIQGQWWRILTCTFVHIGIVHILLNMWVLSDGGPIVERMAGNVGFLVLYLVSGLMGSLASLYWNPMVTSAGASGAVFGVYGAFLGLLLRQRSSIPMEALTQLRNRGLAFLGYNLVFGMAIPNIDMAAHIGGLLGGFFCGLVLSQPFIPAALAKRPLRNVMAITLGIVFVGGGVFAVKNKYETFTNVQQEIQRFSVSEKKALDTLNAANAKAQRNALTNAEYADVLEKEVLPEWRAARERLLAIKQAPERWRDRLSMLLKYTQLRQESWELLAAGAREGDQEKVHQANEKQKLADDVVQRINKADGNK